MKIMLIIICTLLMFASCAGHCIKFNGEYKGIGGEIEYCFNQEKSKQEGLPVLNSEEGTQVIVVEEYLDKILSKLEGFTSKSQKSLKQRISDVLKE